MTEHSWTEIQALAVRAATGAGVPAAQALAFGAMLARHLADGGAQGALRDALETPSLILDIAHRVEALVETASLSPRVVEAEEPDAAQRALMISWLASLPCQSEVEVRGQTLTARLSLTAPSTRRRPVRITISKALLDDMKSLAARTYVPDSAASRAMGAGAGAMELD